jgi:isopenicillin-N epimerase
VSHGASPEYGPANRFHALHDWTGTHDPTAYLAVPAAIDTVAELGGGWPAVIARNHALAVEMRRRFGGPILAPDDAIGSMVSIPIHITGAALAVEKRLLEDGWEIPIVDTSRGTLIRLSAHLYNDATQVDALVAKLRSLGASVA